MFLKENPQESSCHQPTSSDFLANFIPKSFPAKNRNPDSSLQVGPSGGNYSFGHPAGTVGYCAPEVATKKTQGSPEKQTRWWKKKPRAIYLGRGVLSKQSFTCVTNPFRKKKHQPFPETSGVGWHGARRTRWLVFVGGLDLAAVHWRNAWFSTTTCPTSTRGWGMEGDWRTFNKDMCKKKSVKCWERPSWIYLWTVILPYEFLYTFWIKTKNVVVLGVFLLFQSPLQ